MSIKSRLQGASSGLLPFISGLLPLFVLAHFAHHLLTSLAVPLSPFIRTDFGLNYTQAGFIISAFTIAYGIGQLPSGWLADRIGPRIMITVGICGVAVAGVLVGVSQTYVAVAVFLALMGIAGGGYHPAAAPLISASVDEKRRGSALGFHIIGGSASHFLGPLIAAAIAALWGWRGAYLGLAIPTITFGIAFYWLLGRRISKQTDLQRKSKKKSADQPGQGNSRRLTLVIILSTFTNAVMRSAIAFIPLYLVDQFGLSDGAAAATMALYYSVGLWAGPLGGYISDRIGAMPIIVFICLIAGPAVYLLNVVPGGVGIGFLLVVFGIITFVRMPVTESFIVGHTSDRNRSTVLGIYFFGNMEGSGLLVPVIGYLIDIFGFYTSFTIGGVTILAVVVVSSLLLWMNRR